MAQTPLKRAAPETDAAVDSVILRPAKRVCPPAELQVEVGHGQFLEADQPQPGFLAEQPSTREPFNAALGPAMLDMAHAAGTEDSAQTKADSMAQATIAAALRSLMASKGRDAHDADLVNGLGGHLLLPLDSNGDLLLPEPLQLQQQSLQLVSNEDNTAAGNIPAAKPSLGAQHLQGKASEAIDGAAPGSTGSILGDTAAGQYAAGQYATGQYAAQPQPQIGGPSGAAESSLFGPVDQDVAPAAAAEAEHMSGGVDPSAAVLLGIAFVVQDATGGESHFDPVQISMLPEHTIKQLKQKIANTSIHGQCFMENVQTLSLLHPSTNGHQFEKLEELFSSGEERTLASYNLRTKSYSQEPDRVYMRIMPGLPAGGGELASTAGAEAGGGQLVQKKPRRNHNRWNDAEVEKLLSGVESIGIGHWRQLKNEYFALRTDVDLKDKWRNITKAVLLNKKLRGPTQSDEFRVRVLACIEQHQAAVNARGAARAAGGTRTDVDDSEPLDIGSTQMMMDQHVEPLRALPNIGVGLQQQHPAAHMAAVPLGDTAAAPPHFKFESPGPMIDLATAAGLSTEHLGNEAIPEHNTLSP